jgi:magnesium transporter
MSAVSDTLLCRALIERHPSAAAELLEAFDGREVAAVLEEVPPGVAAVVLGRMTPGLSAACLSSMAAPEASAIVASMPTVAACTLLRRMPAAGVEILLIQMAPREASVFRSVLTFPAASAGAVMDPRVVTLAADLSVKESLDRLRSMPADADDELYVVDRDQRLLGVVPARVLVGAMPDARVGSLMSPAEYRVSPRASLDVVRANPGWTEARTLPVVGEDGRLFGAIAFGVGHRPAAPALADGAVSALASFSELAYQGSTLLLASLLVAMSDGTTRSRTQGS